MNTENLEQEIEQLKLRNKQVDKNKAWETSLTRKILIVLFTYIAVAIYLKTVVKIDPWINAIVPTIGFVLSTLTLSYFKALWERYIYKK